MVKKSEKKKTGTYALQVIGRGAYPTDTESPDVNISRAF